MKRLNNSVSRFVQIICKHPFSNHVHQICVKLEFIFVFTYRFHWAVH